MTKARAQKFLLFCAEVFSGVALQRKERAARFLEEAVELAQACEVEQDYVERIVQRCYDRPSGTILKEVSQCMLTLEIFHENERISHTLDWLSEQEAQRCYAIPKEEWHRRHQVKTDAGIAAQIDLTPTIAPCGHPWGTEETGQCETCKMPF